MAPNAVDRRQSERQKLHDALEDAGVELGPQLVGALGGLATEIFEQRMLTEMMIEALAKATEATEGLTAELIAQRQLRSTQP